MCSITEIGILSGMMSNSAEEEREASGVPDGVVDMQ